MSVTRHRLAERRQRRSTSVHPMATVHRARLRAPTSGESMGRSVRALPETELRFRLTHGLGRGNADRSSINADYPNPRHHPRIEGLAPRALQLTNLGAVSSRWRLGQSAVMRSCTTADQRTPQPPTYFWAAVSWARRVQDRAHHGAENQVQSPLSDHLTTLTHVPRETCGGSPPAPLRDHGPERPPLPNRGAIALLP